jgi:hypothetical protein
MGTRPKGGSYFGPHRARAPGARWSDRCRDGRLLKLSSHAFWTRLPATPTSPHGDETHAGAGLRGPVTAQRSLTHHSDMRRSCCAVIVCVPTMDPQRATRVLTDDSAMRGTLLRECAIDGQVVGKQDRVRRTGDRVGDDNAIRCAAYTQRVKGAFAGLPFWWRTNLFHDELFPLRTAPPAQRFSVEKDLWAEHPGV